MAVNLADLNFYRAVNPDLAGFNDPEAFSHLINAGLNEGRVFSPYIDLNLYRAVNTDLAAAGLTSNRQLYDHLQNAGVAEGRTFSPVFDANFYRAANPDLAAAGLNNEQLLDHFRAAGINEGRASAPSFSVSFYIAANPDLQAAGFNFQQALQHYVFAGIREGRTAAPGGPVAPPPPPPPTDPGNTPGSALNVGTLIGTRAFDQFVGFDDREDYYRFDVNSPINFNLYLDGLSASADVSLYEDINRNSVIDSGELIQNTNQYNGASSEVIFRNLAVGTYFVLVKADSEGRNTNYNLRLVNENSEAVDVGLLNGTRTFSEFVGRTDPRDYYRFNLTSPSSFNLTLDGLTATADVLLYEDKNNNGLIGFSDELIGNTNQYNGTNTESISRNLPSGNYFIVVTGDGANTNYNLQISATPGVSPQSANPINLSDSAISEVNVDPIINPRSFNTANESAIQTFTANGSDLTGGLGNATANLLLNESFTGGNDFANLLAANPMETPDFSQGLALI